MGGSRCVFLVAALALGCGGRVSGPNPNAESGANALGSGAANGSVGGGAGGSSVTATGTTGLPSGGSGDMTNMGSGFTAPTGCTPGGPDNNMGPVGCAPGLVCQQGVCVPCPAGTSACDIFAACVDEQTDPNNCGDCGVQCPASAPSCQNGGCVCVGTLCSGTCVDEQTDPNNCGQCGVRCVASSAPTCESGGCVCVTGTVCGGICVDERTDSNNCGGCALTCAPGRICQGGGCVAPPSCAPGGPGMTNCGPGGSGTESCCTSLDVAGGTYYRTYDTLDADGGVALAADGGPDGEADPAVVSRFQLDKYLVTVGRFRQFASAWNGGWTPAAGSGKHTHLNDAQGLVNVGGPADGGIVYEPGWATSDNSNISPTDAALTVQCEPYATWTSSAGANENLPINCVNWYEAYAFCIWDGGGFLPSEAEWEYAAAGGSQQREYPWGSTDPGTSNEYAIYSSVYGCYYPTSGVNQRVDPAVCTGVANIASVGYPALGAGLWGQLDLAGDVFEWTLDSQAIYVNPCVDCAYLTPSDGRVLRGGSFYDGASYLLASDRDTGDLPSPTAQFFRVGFRCARTP
jgi:sulfatase modifying factor 1